MDNIEIPPKEILKEFAQKAKAVWSKRYSDEFGYVTGKHELIDYTIEKAPHSFMSIYQMFDFVNQALFVNSLSKEAKDVLIKTAIRQGYDLSFLIEGLEGYLLEELRRANEEQNTK